MATGDSGFTAAGLRTLRDVLARHVDSGKIPGVVALVGRGEETHVEAIGTMRHDGGAPMSRDTIFRMASTSKPVTVAAAMVLLDECRLRLDDPVDPWLPELADRRVLKRPDGPLEDTVPARRPITVRDLLTSTFGLGTDFELLHAPISAATFERTDYSVASGPAPEPDEWMRRLGELPLSYQPGQRWQYDLSHEVLGVLVSRVTGRPLETFLRERVLDPLGMEDTGFHVPADKIDRLPPLYGPDPRTGEFFRMLLDHGMHGTERILSRPAVELMTTNRLTPEQQAARTGMYRNIAHLAAGQGQHGGWGFGMAVRTDRGDYAPLGQFGWDGGTGTTAYADPSGRITGILLTQVGMSTPDSARLVHDFWTTLYRATA
ncbi:serine hydrolase domain-containing protein [Streptomyces virginiae]|uniref:serine hydrolase domain-containing protein n=1 Tax=Streptomyces virginiae TaxID=1961 RepID=UPI0004C5FD14|nr:serine hydrolase domain-containing protein [Streptomyces virginiae]